MLNTNEDVEQGDPINSSRWALWK